MRLWLWLMMLTLASVVPAEAAPTEEAAIAVFWGGISITGQQDEANVAAPVISRSIREGGEATSALNKRLLSEIQALSPRWIRLEPIGKQPKFDGSTGTIVVTAAIDRESSIVEEIDGQFKLATEIAAQALFFDGKTKQIIGSVPVNVEYIDVLPRMPDATMRSNAILSLRDKPGPYGLIGALADAIASARPSDQAEKWMQLVDTSLADGALSDYPLVERKFRSGVAGLEFSKFFAAGTGLALLPFRGVNSSSVANVLYVSFADGSSANLTIPAPDYAININVDRALHRTISRDASIEERLYGVFFTLSVTQPLSGKTFFNQPLKQGAFKTIPSSQTIVDDEAALYATILEGFASFAVATQGKAADWIAEQPGGRDSKKEWMELRKLIEACR